MQPLRDLLVIQMNEEEKDQKNSIGLFKPPAKWANPQNIGKVISKGVGVSSVGEGDFVFINPYAVIDTQDPRIKIVKEKDILCLLESQDQTNEQ